MANIFDYIDWRDISLEKVEFNEIDNLILARVSYFPFDSLINKGEIITLSEAYRRYMEIGGKGKILIEQDIELFPRLANSIRFGNVKLYNYINKIDPKKDKQFSAITMYLPDDTVYVSYRGTDNTLVGWKEDFNMSFSDYIESQIDAKDYLNSVSLNFKNKFLRVGGHSKGGNLAVFAAAFCDQKIQKKIINVYNNDGPGFSDKVINSEGYQKILDRVHTYIPQSSIIGRLLNHEEKTTILKSTEVGIMQHDLYSWQVLGDKFVETELTDSSEFFDKTITDWLKQVTDEQRSEFFDILFEVLNATNVKTLSELKSNKFSNAKTLIKTYNNLTQESKDIMTKTLSAFFKIGKDNIQMPKHKKIDEIKFGKLIKNKK